MSRRTRNFAALVISSALVLGVATPSAQAAVPPAAPQTVDSWAWCGVDPDDPVAADAVRAMALAGGIDATFGPCNIPDPKFKPPYSPAFTADRYVAPDVYMRLVQLNATVGMKTVVYDKRLWDTDFAIRDQAIAFWKPVLANIAAWDMGDEFDPATPDWQFLVDRWQIMRTIVEPATGIQPFTNFLPFPDAIQQGLDQLPGLDRLLSFDRYQGDFGSSLAAQFGARAKLMCAVNAFSGGPAGVATPTSMRHVMDVLIEAGCDQFLVFGGFKVYETRKPFQFNPDTITEPTGAATELAPVAQEGSGHSSLIPIGPLRVLETRSGPGLGTYDGGFNGGGQRLADSVLALGLAGRPQLPSWARSVVLNITVTGAVGGGYLTVYPCDEPRPTSSNLNYQAGITRAVAVVARIGSTGAVCIYTQTATDVIADVTGLYPTGAAFKAIQPGRLLETRLGPEFTTVDAQSAGIGRRPGGVTTEVKVAGRGGVPNNAISVALNVTAIAPTQPGFVTVFPCGEQIPTASTLNFRPGDIVPNAAIVAIGAGGSVCVFSNVETDLVLDVNGYDAVQSVARFLQPTRIVETRTGLTTADHVLEGNGARPADSVLQVPIGGRVGVPPAIRAAVLNITVTESTGSGFVTVYPCDQARPTASTLNFNAGTTVANLTVASTTKDGKVCIYTQRPTHLVVDLSGYHT
jgi:hypothetical protein